MVASSARRFHLALLALLVSAVPSYAKCDPTTDPDKSDIANARAAVAANCDCAGATSHGAYVSCAAQQANTVLTNKSCAGAIKKCASHSTCGKPDAVTCCLTTTKGTKCKIKKDAAHCTAKQGTVGSCTSCCDACPAPGSGPSCPAPTTTTIGSGSTTTTTTTTTTMASVCGNGIVEQPEWCDGESFCESNCTIYRYACCEYATSGGACSADVAAYTLFAYQYSECGNYGGTFMLGKAAPSGAAACADPPSGPSYAVGDGACVEPPPLPTPIDLCCQYSNPYCMGTGSTTDNDAITGFIWNCAYSNYPNIPIVRGTCGGDGNCVFAP